MQQPLRHAFDDEIDRIKQRDGSSRFAAMTTARLENPALYSAYQQFHSGQTTSQQAMARSRSMAKLTHEDEVGRLLAKGFSQTVAEQIVQNQFGSMLPRRNDAMAKAADTIVCKFMRLVDQEMQASGCERHDAMRKVRLAEPDLFEAYALV